MWDSPPVSGVGARAGSRGKGEQGEETQQPGGQEPG